MISHSIGFAVALALTGILTPLWARYLMQRNLAIVKPRPRDVHRDPIPRLGGVVVTGVFLLVISGFLIFAPEHIALSPETLFGLNRNVLGLIIGTLILMVIGIIDDIRGLSVGPKLVGQILAAAMLPVFGVRVQHLTNPFGGSNFELSPLVDSLGTIFWVVLIINVVNFLDGLDGLATSVSAIALSTLYLLALAPFVAQPALALIVVVLLGSALGFLPFNWHQARIFLGGGAETFGYLLGAAAIISGGKLATAALVLAIPILDTLWVIIRRLLVGRSPFTADREHLHHQLLSLGLSQPVVVGILMTASLVFGMIALASQTAGKLQGLMASVIVMLLFLGGLALVRRFRHKQKEH